MKNELAVVFLKQQCRVLAACDDIAGVSLEPNEGKARARLRELAEVVGALAREPGDDPAEIDNVAAALRETVAWLRTHLPFTHALAVEGLRYDLEEIYAEWRERAREARKIVQSGGVEVR
ncbi:MAG: hypothetical protein AAFU79_13785 [Myxococcota bacterium]